MHRIATIAPRHLGRGRALCHAFLAALLALAAGPAAAEMRQSGNLIFPLPPGWEAPRGDDFLSLWSDLPDKECEYCRIVIGPDDAAPANLSRWLDQHRTAFVDEEDRDDIEKGEPASPTRVGKHDAAMLMQRDGNDIQVLLAVKAGDRVQLVGFIGDGADRDELMATSKVIDRHFMPWVNLLRYRSEGAASLLGAPEPGDMAGLWWGWRLDSTVGMDGMFKTDNSYRHVQFWPDGTFHDATPPGGVAAPDRAALAKGPGDHWGNYRHEGDRITLTYADGDQAELTRAAGGWTLDDYELAEATPLPDGARLDGGTSTMSFTGFAPGTTSGGVASSSETNFKPDGSYTGSSFGGGFGSFQDGGGFSAGSSRDTGGRYEVRDGLLIFHPKGGTEKAVLAFRTPGGEIMLGEDFLDGKAR